MAVKANNFLKHLLIARFVDSIFTGAIMQLYIHDFIIKHRQELLQEIFKAILFSLFPFFSFWSVRSVCVRLHSLKHLLSVKPKFDTRE